MSASGSTEWSLPVWVVSGLPRSGTSLGMALLEACGIPLLEDAHRPPDPDNPRGYREYEPVKRLGQDASWVAEARGRALKVVHALLPALPEDVPCRVLWMRRRLDEVVASQEAMLRRRGEEPGPLQPAQWVAILERQVARARAWRAQRPGVAWLELDYNVLVLRPEGELERLRAFVGRPVDLGALARVVEPSLHRQRGGGASG